MLKRKILEEKLDSIIGKIADGNDKILQYLLENPFNKVPKKTYDKFLYFIYSKLGCTIWFRIEIKTISMLVNTYFKDTNNKLNFKILEWCKKYNVKLDTESIDILYSKKYVDLLGKAKFRNVVSERLVRDDDYFYKVDASERELVAVEVIIYTIMLSLIGIKYTKINIKNFNTNELNIGNICESTSGIDRIALIFYMLNIDADLYRCGAFVNYNKIGPETLLIRMSEFGFFDKFNKDKIEVVKDILNICNTTLAGNDEVYRVYISEQIKEYYENSKES